MDLSLRWSLWGDGSYYPLNFCLSLILRDTTYVLYWYLLVQSSYQFIYGHAFRFWWPDSPELQVPSIVFGGLFVVVLAIQFSRSFLKTAMSYPAWDRYLKYLSLASVVLLGMLTINKWVSSSALRSLSVFQYRFYL